MVIIIVFSILIFIIFIIVFIYIKNKNDKKKVINSSITVKKIKELNEKFPKINIEYNHNFSDCIHFKTRASVTNFKPDKYFINFKPELVRIASIRLKNVFYYEKYKDLFEKTVKQVITPETIISNTNIKPSKYKKIEKEFVYFLFDRKLDSKEITYKINALYISPKGRNTYSSPYYSYGEKDFIKNTQSFKLDIDYSPIYKEDVILDKQEKVKKKEIVESKENILIEKDDVTLVEKKDIRVSDGGVIYNIVDDLAYAIGIENNNLILKNKISYKDLEFKTIFENNIFLGNKTIKSLTISEGIECVEDSMFKNCTSLESIQFPSSLKIIKKKALSGCLKLKTVTIPRNVESIEEEAFSLCSSLNDIYLFASIKNVGPSIFWYSNKAKIHILSGNDISHFDPEWNVDENEVIFE